MADYINRDSVTNLIKLMEYSNGVIECYADEFISDINAIPSADVVEVKTAHWVRMSEKEVFGEINMQCSECAFDDWRTPSYWKTWGNFCPNCGADMRGRT